MGTDLQRLRDEAERRSRVAANHGDRDTADAWERIGIAIDDCIKATKHDLVIIEARTGLFGLRVSRMNLEKDKLREAAMLAFDALVSLQDKDDGSLVSPARLQLRDALAR